MTALLAPLGTHGPDRLGAGLHFRSLGRTMLGAASIGGITHGNVDPQAQASPLVRWAAKVADDVGTASNSR